ncbi:MAG: transcriptional repressor [Chlorobiales bacterium]|nr:transcriptional repressor [Chlorobiales bacterium]
MLVLREIYESPDHHDADEIFLNLKQKGHDVSRATVYNTLDLLVECNLVEQNSFGHKHLHYERSYGYRPHHHIVCEKCGHVFEFQSPEIDQELLKICEEQGFKLKRNNLQLFGECIQENCDGQKTPEEDAKTTGKHSATRR